MADTSNVMNIKMKMGKKSSLPNNKDIGSIYFAKDTESLAEGVGFGELYYDDEEGNRIKVGGTNISALSFDYWSEDGSTNMINNKLRAKLTMEDGSIIISNPIPEASPDSDAKYRDGLITGENQIIMGTKEFSTGTFFGIGDQLLQYTLNVHDFESTGMPFLDSYRLAEEYNVDKRLLGFYAGPMLVGDNMLLGSLLATPGTGVIGAGIYSPMFGELFLDPDLMLEILPYLEEVTNCDTSEVIPSDGALFINGSRGIFFGDNQTNVMVFRNGHLWTKQIGAQHENFRIESIWTDNFDANHINCNDITGSLNGVATYATKLENPIIINGTSIYGDEKDNEIITDYWGSSRNFKISNMAASSTDYKGTDVNGSGNIELFIPDSMEGFNSISTVNLTSDIINATTLKILNGSDKVHNITSGASTSRNMYLDDASGYFAYVDATNTSGVGDINSPIFVNTTGKLQACTQIAVDHGGTGCATLTQGAALIGNGTDAITTRDITNITTAGNIDSNDNLITANTLNNWKGTSNIVTIGTISSGTWQGASIKVGYGGTGTDTAPVQGGIIYGSSTSAYGCTNAGSSGQLLQSNGTAEPSWTTDDKGSAEKPVYLNKGVLTECSKNFDEYLPLTGGTITGTVIFNDPIKFNTTSYGVSLPNSGDNGQLFFVEDDGVLITTNYGENDPDSSTKGYGIEGALYFKILKES